MKGYARFEDPHTLIVDDHTKIQAKSIVLAVGSTPISHQFLVIWVIE